MQATYCIQSGLRLYTFRPHSVTLYISGLVLCTFRPHTVYFQASYCIYPRISESRKLGIWNPGIPESWNLGFRVLKSLCLRNKIDAVPSNHRACAETWKSPGLTRSREAKPYKSERERTKKTRKCCAWQAKHDFEAFCEISKNRANAIGVSDFAFSTRKKRQLKDQKRSFWLRGVEKSSRWEGIKKTNKNGVDQSKTSKLAETSEENMKSDRENTLNLKFKKKDFSWEGSSFSGRQGDKQNWYLKTRNHQKCDRGVRFCVFYRR